MTYFLKAKSEKVPKKLRGMPRLTPEQQEWNERVKKTKKRILSKCEGTNYTPKGIPTIEDVINA